MNDGLFSGRYLPKAKVPAGRLGDFRHLQFGQFGQFGQFDQPFLSRVGHRQEHFVGGSLPRIDAQSDGGLFCIDFRIGTLAAANVIATCESIESR